MLFRSPTPRRRCSKVIMGCSTSEEKCMKEKGVLLGVGSKRLRRPSACSLDQWRRYSIHDEINSTTQLNGLTSYGFGEVAMISMLRLWMDFRGFFTILFDLIFTFYRTEIERLRCTATLSRDFAKCINRFRMISDT